jgi:hypothetical protein
VRPGGDRSADPDLHFGLDDLGAESVAAMTDLSPTAAPAAPARPKARTVLHRLWVTVAVLAWLLGVGISGYAGICYLHDAPIRGRMQTCLQTAQRDGALPAGDRRLTPDRPLTDEEMGITKSKPGPKSTGKRSAKADPYAEFQKPAQQPGLVVQSDQGDWVEVWNVAWIDRCHLAPDSTEHFARSRETWGSTWVDLSDGSSAPTWSSTWPIMLASWVPFVFLAILRLWIGWMARPEVA